MQNRAELCKRQVKSSRLLDLVQRTTESGKYHACSIQTDVGDPLASLVFMVGNSLFFGGVCVCTSLPVRSLDFSQGELKGTN